MRSLGKLIQIEARLFLRDPMTFIVGLLLPTVVLIGLGAVPALRERSEDIGGQRFIDYFAPSTIVMAVGVIGLTNLPVVLATYREQGVLRRMRATPVAPAQLLLAQLVVNIVASLASALLVIASGRIVYGVPLPQHPLGFLIAFLLGITAVFALGMLVAAVAPTARAATGLSTILFMAAMFFGGVYLPRFMLPDAVANIGAFVPPGVQSLLDAWTGTAPAAIPLVAMAATAIAAGAVAARVFKWE
ncbi:ABC transporter permease [Glycomyces algeriensis]|uniref:Transport permease protein n=1 Tax=Glycomyces algeriensis TaxID=256037 RepID=A0A9W6LI01_9ACTN|nr:ABC transporter permease [Glycomyces algeriensis]MDA1368193.1 ABC transporter permease [Glycomyces algeriensis]MDR7351833.1 ABC-2 type transport system permease protein [Glycomyces algeriensis]GLI44562.1 transport permease protein [Glycomyces algeriensis]